MPVTIKKIASTTVGAGGTLQIDFSSIPATYTDLLVKVSSRDDRGADTTGATMKLNDSTTGFTTRRLYGNGATAISDSTSNNTIFDADNAANSTASVFSSWEIYIPNYAGSTNKSFSVDAAMENNTTTAFPWLLAGLWSNTSSITKVSLLLSGTIKFVQHTTAVLYGISKS